MAPRTSWLGLLSDQRLGARPRTGSSTRDPGEVEPGGRQAAPASAPVRSLKTGPRTDFQRDFDRIVFSTAFRRLHDKTQVFPLPDNDLVHSRLTHSLEVSCVGRSLGTMVGEVVVDRHPGLSAHRLSSRDLGDIVAAACLAHDLGNPPFGHAGEDAIGSWFREHPEYTRDLAAKERSDLECFEGNAQGFRILTRLQMPAKPGLQLTCATLGAFTKYPRESGPRPIDPPIAAKKHGFFQAEIDMFRTVARVTGVRRTDHEWPSGGPEAYARHPLAYLVEAADDICYSILDIEDGFRLRLVGFREVFERLEPIAERDATYRRPLESEDQKEAIAYLRAKSINQLAHEIRDVFLDLEAQMLEGRLAQSLSECIEAHPLLEEVISFTRERCYRARDVLEVELAGYGVLRTLLSELVPAVMSSEPSRKQRMLLDAIDRHPQASDGAYPRLLLVTDYLSGMTDSYAVSFFRKLSGMSLS